LHAFGIDTSFVIASRANGAAIQLFFTRRREEGNKARRALQIFAACFFFAPSRELFAFLPIGWPAAASPLRSQ
jgi:hypothetical protein